LLNLTSEKHDICKLFVVVNCACIGKKFEDITF